MARRSMVIKAVEAVPLEGAVLKPFHFTDMMGEVNQALISARAESARILAQAKAQEDLIRQAASDQGFQAGFAEGMAKGQEQGRAEAFEAATKEFAASQKSLISSCEQIIAQINDKRVAWEAAARQDLVDLAMAIARRVVRHVSDHDRQVVLANMEEAVRLAGKRSEVTIMVNPGDAEAARVFARSLADRRAECREVQVIESTEASPGGCRIDWGSGAVDAGIETQLDRIAAELGVREPGCSDESATRQENGE
jgi:flagellar assembly protein FliH